MAYWNHFAEDGMTKISFKDILVGEKFRVARWRLKRRSVVIAIKTGDLSYREQKSKAEYTIFSNELKVYKF